MADNQIIGGVARAYQLSKALPTARVPASSKLEAVDRPSFADLIPQRAQESLNTIRAGDHAARAGLAGTMPLQQVVEATMAMQSEIEIAVSIRDKVVAAYNDILKMAV